jgi:hypothetical protein
MDGLEMRTLRRSLKEQCTCTVCSVDGAARPRTSVGKNTGIVERGWTAEVASGEVGRQILERPAGHVRVRYL